MKHTQILLLLVIFSVSLACGQATVSSQENLADAGGFDAVAGNGSGFSPVMAPSGDNGGTEADNPAGTYPGSRLAVMADAMCRVLAGLDSPGCLANLSYERCITGLLPLKGVSAAVGLSSAYEQASVQQIMALEQSHQLQADRLAADRCIQEMYTLDCGSPQIENAFPDPARRDFSEVTSVLNVPSGVCRQVFGAAPIVQGPQDNQ